MRLSLGRELKKSVVGSLDETVMHGMGTLVIEGVWLWEACFEEK